MCDVPRDKYDNITGYRVGGGGDITTTATQNNCLLRPNPFSLPWRGMKDIVSFHDRKQEEGGEEG